jgi:putative ABC transport system permease protein
VVLSTAVGVFALGLVFGSSGVMRARMTESHQESHPPHIEMYTSLFDLDTLETVLREPGVAEVEAERRASFRWKREGESDWHDGTLIARPDCKEQRMYPIQLLEGEWPAGRDLAMERLSADYYHLPIGTTILVEVGERERRLTITGIARHPYTPPPMFTMGNAAFIATPETVAWLTDQPEGFDTLNIRLDSFSQEGAEAAAVRIKERLERAGMVVGYYDIVDPQVHWGQQMIDAVFLVLTVLGALALGLSGFLIINIMNALITQQVWQIGVMKVVGATFRRVVRVYLATAVIYSLLALLLAVPLGAVAADLLAAWMLDLFNIIGNGFRVIPTAVAVQVVVGLIVPLLAALVPVIGGARISAHRAISTYGLGGQFGRGWFDRLIGQIRFLSRPVALSLRNTFRRKARVALTLIALTLGGVMFIMVLSVSASFNRTVDVLLNDFGFDVLVVFDRAHRAERLVEATGSVTGVTRVEVWDVRGAALQLDNGEELRGQLWAVPDGSQLFHPRIVSGRALRPDDGRAILLNQKIAVDEGIQVGDVVTTSVAGKDLTWTVVGTLINLNDNQQDNFVPLDVLQREIGSSGRGAFVMLTTAGHDYQTHRRTIEALRAAYKERRMKAVYFQSAGDVREQNKAQFNVLTYLMLTMAILAAVVGSIGLMGTMSINVVERGREIGVMRSIGATSLAIARIFVIEGVLIGVLSWLLAWPLSYPGALAFSNAVGQAVIHLPLDFAFSVNGVVLWLGVVLVLSALASLWPALRATQVSVREALAYE